MITQLLSRGALPATALMLVTACAQTATPVSAPLPATAGNSSIHFNTRPRGSATTIYVYASQEGTANDVEVVTTGKTPKVVDTITQGIDFPLGMTIDKSGTLYVANGNATVTEYPSGQNTPSVTLSQGLTAPSDVAVDKSGNVWVSNGSDVLEYPKGSQSPSFTLTDGLNGADAVAIDADGTLYVSNEGTSGHAYVAVFAPGATKPRTTFGAGNLTAPCGLTLDPTGNIYVADFYVGTVLVFAHRGHKLLRTVDHQPLFSQPCGVTIDTRSRLYLGGGGNASDEILVQIPDLGKGAVGGVNLTFSYLYGVAADPTIEP
jgi:streptogramin lyase